MSYIVVQDGKISLTAEASTVPTVIALHSAMKQTGLFMDCIKFVYYFADKYSPYINYIPSDRITKIRREQLSYLPENDYLRISTDPLVLDLIEAYKSDTYDLLDRSWDGAKIRVDNFLKHLNNIPMEYEETVVHEATDEDGKKHKIKLIIKRSNQEEYWKALNTYNNVLKFVQSVEKEMIKDIKEGKRKNIKRRLFDDETSLNVTNNGPRLIG